MPEDRETVPTGERVAERVAGVVGSWPFIASQAVFLFAWFMLNSLPFVFHWDPYPWMAANIVMSAEAAFTGPILLIAANVSARRDRAQAEHRAQMQAVTEAIVQRLDQALAHLGAIAAADHVEHGNLLRELHAHISCQGHTHLGVTGETLDTLADAGLEGQETA